MFLGTYSCKELDITYTIKLENSNLCIDIYGKTYKLDSRMENTFCFDEFLITFHTKKTKGNGAITSSISSERLKKLEFIKENIKQHPTKNKAH